MQKTYDPAAHEQAIYDQWEKAGAFKPDPEAMDTFTISMPPPNATGQLHLGHAIMLAVEDILIRHARMQGKAALWVPGTDHAAIATESVVIRKLQAEGVVRPREELGREGLLDAIKDYVEGSRSTIRNQVRRMGSSCDWSRERYTMDEALNRCVNEVFKKMYEDGLLYRGARIVNWDPKMQTTVSDDELERKEEQTPFYTFQFGPFQIGTARPETKFGDKYVVVHPDDERYAAFKHGDTFDCEWINGRITATLIKDEAIDREFGTGAMTITPWHDATDFEIAQRHGLERVQVIDLNGQLLEVAGEFAGQDRIEARAAIVSKLEQKGLLVSVDEDYTHNVSVNYRGKGIIEPQIIPQWFIDVNKPVDSWQVPEWQGKSLKQVLQQVVQEKAVQILPERFEKTYFHWIDNLRDWCVSRQIWWGHRIPAWYRQSALSGEAHLPVTMRLGNDPDPNDIYVGVTPPDNPDQWVQDPDTLDTWFSSALWTWSTLVDEGKAGDFSLSLEQLLAQSPDFQRFHPTQVMETGYDILFFWVARMILMTTYNVGQIPFKTVYLHGLVRTRDGSKMSKSHPESVIDPLDMIDKYGTDALRLALVVGTSPGNDTRLYEEKIAGYRNFCNKLWNAARFVVEGQDEAFYAALDYSTVRYAELHDFERWIVRRLDTLIQEAEAELAEYQLGEFAQKLYDFVWSDYCDWFIEWAKGPLRSEDVRERSRVQFVLLLTLQNILKLLHPYVPFVTEQLWQTLREQFPEVFENPDEQPLIDHSPWLIQAAWPDTSTLAPMLVDRQEDKQTIPLIRNLITRVRNLKSELGIANLKDGELRVSVEDAVLAGALQEPFNLQLIQRSLGIATLHIQPELSSIEADYVKFAVEGAEAAMRFASELDDGAKRAKLEKDLEEVNQGIAHAERLLGNEAFVRKAPDQVVQAEKDKLAQLKDRQAILQGQLSDA